MTDLQETLGKALNQLVLEGTVILGKEAAGSLEEFAAELRSSLGKKGAAATKPKKPEAKKPETSMSSMYERILDETFAASYQRWYSAALPVISQILPDRHQEFRELYRLDRRPKELDPSNFSISDYINGLTVTRGLSREPAFDTKRVALSRLQMQLNILDSAKGRLESALRDIHGTVEATLLDDELDVARELARNKYLRAAGVVAGVVLERHLKRLVATHEITFRKKAQIGNLNDALREAGIYGVPQWRQIQHLADVRNLCGHSADEEPTLQQVQDLLDGVARVVATVF